MKRFFLILAFLIALLIGAIFVIAIPHAEKTIETHLHNLSYRQVSIQQAEINLTGLSFDTVHLDQDGFNTIENLDITLFWPSYIFKRKIDEIEIGKIAFYVTQRDLRRAVRRLTRIDEFITLPAHNIDIQNVEISMRAGTTSLRFDGNLQIRHEHGKHHLNGQLNAQQYDVNFNSQWTGLINEAEEVLEIDGTIDGLDLKSNTINVNRGTGWVSYHAKGADNILGAQFDAGSGRIFNLPANQISLTIGQNENSYPVLFRSKLSGVENTYLNADFTYHNDVAQREFQSLLSIGNKQEFLNHLASLNLMPTTETPNNTSLDVTLQYDADKRFPAGPLPFNLSSNQDIEGTLLFYPDSYELRGTVQSNKDDIALLKNIFEIGDENITDNVIRLDQNIQSFF